MNKQVRIAIGVVALVTSLATMGAVAIQRNVVAPSVAAANKAYEIQEQKDLISDSAAKACDMDAKNGSHDRGLYYNDTIKDLGNGRYRVDCAWQDGGWAKGDGSPDDKFVVLKQGDDNDVRFSI